MSSEKTKKSLSAWSICSWSIFSSTSASWDKARDNAVCSSALPNIAALLANCPVFSASSEKVNTRNFNVDKRESDIKHKYRITKCVKLMENIPRHLFCVGPEPLWKSVTFSAVDQELQSVVVSLQTTVNYKII